MVFRKKDVSLCGQADRNQGGGGHSRREQGQCEMQLRIESYKGDRETDTPGWCQPMASGLQCVGSRGQGNVWNGQSDTGGFNEAQ